MITVNVEKWIVPLLDCLRAQTYRDFDVRILDDGSTDDTVALASSSSLPNLEVSSVSSPIGRCAQINSVCPLSNEYDYVLFLNAASSPGPNFIENLTKLAASLDVTFGGLTAQVIDRSTRRYFQPRRTLGFRNLIRNLTREETVSEAAIATLPELFEVDSFWGCAAIISARLVDELRFDDTLWAFGDEDDFAARARRAGYKFYWTTQVSIVYTVGASTRDASGPSRIRAYLGLRNHIYLTLKYRPGAEAALGISASVAYSIAVTATHPRLLRSVLQAIGWNAERLRETLHERQDWMAGSSKSGGAAPNG